MVNAKRQYSLFSLSIEMIFAQVSAVFNLLKEETTQLEWWGVFLKTTRRLSWDTYDYLLNVSELEST